MSVAMHLHPMLEILFIASALVLAVPARRHERVEKSQR